MLRRKFKTGSRAQIFVEYAIVVGAVTMVLIAMNVMIKRGIQGMVKSVADQIGEQANADQSFDEAGHLESQYSSTRMTTDKRTRELIGVMNYIYDDIVETESNMIVNLGFSGG